MFDRKLEFLSPPARLYSSREIKEYRENIMRQLSFEFIREVEFIFQKGELIKQMARAIIRVNESEGGKNSDNLANQ